MKYLTIQVLIDFDWLDIAKLTLFEPEKGMSGSCVLEYDLDYAIGHIDRRDQYACSLVLPVQLIIQHEAKHWFGFLQDIMPAGAARRYWVNYLNLQHIPFAEQDSILLEKGSIAPVGNLRIKEAIPMLNEASTLHLRQFEILEVANRNADFLEYAQQMGAISGGATGANGEAPKLLIRLSPEQKVWIDTFQQQFDQADQHYLVKFPRNQRSEIDCNILRAEYYYYQELAELGFSTIAISDMKLLEGEHYPSLWLPRFDTLWQHDRWLRYGMESVYSILDQAAGSHLNHFVVIERLCSLLSQINQDFDSSTFVCEWLQRDLLNIIFGNADNHGRNTSFLKGAGQIELAPIYDFAPMKADPEGIIRLTTWGSPCEEGGEYRWHVITEKLAMYCPPEQSIHALNTLAHQLTGLKQRLIDKGVPQQIINMPVLGFDYIEDKLQRWALL